MTDQTDFFEHLDLTEPGAAEALINAYAQPVAHLLTSLDLVSEGELEDALIGLFAAVVATQDRFDPSIDPSIVSWFYRQAIPNLLGFADRRDRKELARRLPALLAAPPHNLTETEIGIVLNLREQTVAKQIREVSVLHDSRDKLQGWDLGPDSISAAVTARLAANATEKQAGENGRRIAWKEAGLAVLAAGVVLVLIFLFLRSDQSERGVDLFQEEPNLPDPITTVSSEVRRTGSGGSPDAEFRLSTYPILSDNGRYLLFTSNQPDLVADDGNDAYDIFVRETATGVIHRVSLGPGGVELFGESFSGAISADGSRVVFITEQATVGGKVTVRDWQTGESRIISGEPDRQGYPSFIAPGISGDGNIIVYWGVSPNPDICGSGESFPHVCYDLVVYEYSSETFHQIPFGKPHFDFFQTTRLTFDGDLLALTLNEGDLPWSRLGSTNRAEAVLYDWRQDRITLLNTAPDGTIGNRPSSNPVISTDGTKAVFLSLADNETASGDGDDDVLVLFYTDREAGVLRQIRPPSIERGPELNPGESALYLGFDLSPDGRYVIFADLFTTPEFFDLGSRHCGLLFGEWRCLNSLLYDAVEDTFQQLPVEPIMASLPEVHLLYWPSISQNAEFIAFQAGGWELQPPCPMEGCMSVWLLSPEAGSADLASRPTAPVSGLGSTPQWTLSGGIPGPSGWVNAVAFSPGGRLIASGRADGSIQIADLAGVEEPYILGKLPDDISSLAFSPQGLRLAAGSHDGTVTIWDLETRSLAATLHGHPGLVLSVAFSPDGSSIAVGTQQSLWTWTDSATGFFQSGGFTQKNVQAIDFSPGGAHLAAVSDNEVWIRNIATGVVTARLGGHTDRVLALAFTAAGGGSYLLATGSRDDTAQIWRLSTSMEAEHLVTLEHGSWVSAVAFSPEGELLATGGYDSSIYLWDTNGFALGPPLHRSSQDQILALDFSPVGGLLAAGSVNGLRVWQPERSDFELPLTSRYFRFLGPGPFNPAPQYLDNWFHDRPEIELQTFGTLPPTLEAAGNGFRTLQPVPESMTLQSAGVFNSETGDTVGLIQIYVFTSFFGPARLTFLQTSWDLRMVDWPVSPAAMLVEAQVEGLPGEIVIGGWGFEEALQDGMTIRDWAHDASSLSIRWQDDDWYYSVFLDMPFDMGLIIDSELRIDLNGLIDLIETGWKQ